jgi:hypothetical protein
MGGGTIINFNDHSAILTLDILPRRWAQSIDLLRRGALVSFLRNFNWCDFLGAAQGPAMLDLVKFRFK